MKVKDKLKRHRFGVFFLFHYVVQNLHVLIILQRTKTAEVYFKN